MRSGRSGRTRRRKTELTCYFCGEKLDPRERDPRAPGFAHLEFYSQADPADGRTMTRTLPGGERCVVGALGYPTRPQDAPYRGDFVAVFSHASCGPDCGYWLSFDRLDEDWDGHLSEKVWWSPVIATALEKARALAGVGRPRSAAAW